MITIVGVGSALAPLTLGNEDLAAAERVSPQSVDLMTESRRISVPLETICGGGGFDIIARRSGALCSPTDIGALAVQEAVKAAGISLEQVGLLIGDCGTPYESCPSEGQRIAGRLGLRIPAYDIVGGLAALPLFLHLAEQWKPERFPDYVVFVSTNLPSQHVDYGEHGVEPFLFGDGAGAIVVQPNASRGMRLRDIEMTKGTRKGTALRLAQRVKLNHDAILSEQEMQTFVRERVARACGHAGISPERLWCVGPELYSGMMRRCVAETGIVEDRFVSSARTNGFSLGASQMIALSRVAGQVEAEDHILVMHTGDGTWSGSALLTMMAA